MKERYTVNKWQPDERGAWQAYKCPFGRNHWHVGHAPITKGKEGSDE